MQIIDGTIILRDRKIKTDKLNAISMYKQDGEYRLTCTEGIVNTTLAQSENRDLILNAFHVFKQMFKEEGYDNFIHIGNDLINLDLIDSMHYRQLGASEHYVQVNWKGMEGYRRVKSQEDAERLIVKFNNKYADYLGNNIKNI